MAKHQNLVMQNVAKSQPMTDHTHNCGPQDPVTYRHSSHFSNHEYTVMFAQGQMCLTVHSSELVLK